MRAPARPSLEEKDAPNQQRKVGLQARDATASVILRWGLIVRTPALAGESGGVASGDERVCASGAPSARRECRPPRTFPAR